MKIRTADLTERALDWAVAKCEGHDVGVLTIQEQEDRWFEDVDPDKLAKEREGFNRYIRETLRPAIRIKGEEGYKRHPTHREAAMLYGQGIPTFAYSTSWAQGGPIIEREGIRLHRSHTGAWWAGPESDPHRPVSGPTPLIAAMRCYVASKMGDTIDIPEELK